MHIDYVELWRNSLLELGYDLWAEYNCFEPPYNADHGWPLKLPNPQWRSNTLVLLHFQDFVTVDNGIRELQAVEEFYGDHSHRVLVVHWTADLGRYYSGPINLIEFATHTLWNAQRLLLRQDEWISDITVHKSLGWQCLNGRICQHRQRVADVLQTWPNGVLSLSHYIPLTVSPYQDYRGCENDDNFLRLKSLYAQCRVNIITETEYRQPPGIITEKTHFAMAALQIPIIIGFAGAVDVCRRMGYDMLDDVVDHSYDRLPNDQRAEAALDLNRDLIISSIDRGHELKDRLLYNQNQMLHYIPRAMITNWHHQIQMLRLGLSI